MTRRIALTDLGRLALFDERRQMHMPLRHHQMWKTLSGTYDARSPCLKERNMNTPRVSDYNLGARAV